MARKRNNESARATHALWYAANRDLVLARMARYRAINRDAYTAKRRNDYAANPYRLRIVEEKLIRGVCANGQCPVGIPCTQETIACFDFDHREPQEKVDCVGNYASWRKLGMPALEDEMAKCDLLCVWCHRLRSHQEGHLGRRSGRILPDNGQLSLLDLTSDDPA